MKQATRISAQAVFLLLLACSSGSVELDEHASSEALVDTSSEVYIDEVMAEAADAPDLEPGDELPRPEGETDEVTDVVEAEADVEETADTSTPCLDADVLLSVDLCDPSFASCESIDELPSAWLRGQASLRATVTCAPSPPYRLFLRVVGDGPDSEPVETVCDDTPECELSVETFELDVLENATVSAKLIWGEGWNTSRVWTKVLPVYDCPLDPERLFCVRYGEWEERSIPITQSEETRTIAMDEHEGSSYFLLSNETSSGDEGSEHVDVYFARYRLAEDDWTIDILDSEVEPLVADLVAGVSWPLVVTGDGFEVATVGNLGYPAVIVGYDGATLTATEILDAEAVRNCRLPYDERSVARTTEFAIVDGVRHLLMSWTSEYAYITDAGGSWSCAPFATTYAADSLGECGDWWEESANDVLLSSFASNSDGILHVSAVAGGGYLLYGTLEEGGSWHVESIPPFGMEPEVCLTSGARTSTLISSVGTIEVFTEQNNTPGVSLPLDRYPGQDEDPAIAHWFTVLRRTKLRNGRVKIDEDLTFLAAELAEAGMLVSPGVWPTPGGRLFWGSHGVALDSCGRMHGALRLAATNVSGGDNYDYPYPVGIFSNVSGEWQIEAVPELELFSLQTSPELSVAPDGSLHLFGTSGASLTPELGVERNRLHHYVRPCLEVLAD